MMNNSKFLILAQRIGSLRDLFRDEKLDGYLETNPSNLFYLTDFGHEGYSGLIGLKDSWIILPNLLYQHAASNTRDFHCVKGKFFQALKFIIQHNKFRRLAFNASHVPYQLGVELKKLGFIPTSGLVEGLRVVKDSFELERMRKANHLAYVGAEFLRKRIKPGITERRLAADLARLFHSRGHGLAFDTIIAAGPNSAYPHHSTSNYRLRKGEPVICDIGVVWEGYRSDLTRTFCLGKISRRFHRVFTIVAQAQKEAIRHLKSGVTAQSIDAAARGVIKKKGFGSAFVHSTGHGVGIDIHEDPRIASKIKTKLRSGMVVTVEPGIYLPGEFGVRIEDTLLVTHTGSEVLTK